MDKSSTSDSEILWMKNITSKPVVIVWFIHNSTYVYNLVRFTKITIDHCLNIKTILVFIEFRLELLFKLILFMFFICSFFLFFFLYFYFYSKFQ